MKGNIKMFFLIICSFLILGLLSFSALSEMTDLKSRVHKGGDSNISFPDVSRTPTPAYEEPTPVPSTNTTQEKSDITKDSETKDSENVTTDSNPVQTQDSGYQIIEKEGLIR